MSAPETEPKATGSKPIRCWLDHTANGKIVPMLQSDSSVHVKWPAQASGDGGQVRHPETFGSSSEWLRHLNSLRQKEPEQYTPCAMKRQEGARRGERKKKTQSQMS
jgi:hypothetical protein